MLVLPQSSEQNRCIIYKRVNARELRRAISLPQAKSLSRRAYLLEEGHSHGDCGALAVSRCEEIKPSSDLKGDGASSVAMPSPQQFALQMDLCDNTLPFLLHSIVITREAADLA